MLRAACCVLGLLYTLPTYAQELTEQELEALTMIREADLGIERVYVDQYQFYYVLPEGLETPEYQWRGALLWRYDGQYLFTEEPEAPSQPRTFVEPDYVLTGLDFDADAYFGVGTAEKIDRYGRRWVLEHVDVEAARAIHLANDAAADEMFGTPEPGVEANPGIEYNPSAGTEHQVLATSWDVVNCNGYSEYFDHQGNGDLTQATAVPMNDRQRKIVIIYRTSGLCTGTMVDSNSVLTAAHCLTTSGGIQYNAANFTVCSMENLDENTTGSYEAGCFGVVDVDVSPGWDGTDNLEVEEDYGLLHLDGSPGVGWFEISSASDATITGPTDYVRGYPGQKRNCDANNVTNNALTTDDDYDGKQMYSADGEVQSTPSGWVKWDTSVALGVSGGPHFYCPNTGGCSNGHYLTGVQSSISLSCPTTGSMYYSTPCSSGWAGGPKGRDIETWVDNNL